MAQRLSGGQNFAWVWNDGGHILLNDGASHWLTNADNTGEIGNRIVAERSTRQPGGQLSRKRYDDMKAAALAAEAERIRQEQEAQRGKSTGER